MKPQKSVAEKPVLLMNREKIRQTMSSNTDLMTEDHDTRQQNAPAAEAARALFHQHDGAFDDDYPSAVLRAEHAIQTTHVGGRIFQRATFSDDGLVQQHMGQISEIITFTTFQATK